jgi:hypothetical protein|tara:strand:+ start:595 stop:804 length:210 start_codon:yes stop_codon:yes gene_type:complete
MKNIKDYLPLAIMVTTMTASSVYWYYSNPIPFVFFFIFFVILIGVSLDKGNKENIKEKQDSGEYFKFKY